MNTPNAPDLAAENAELRARLAEAEETLEAIRTGAVDALVTTGPKGEQVFTLQSAETPYRVLMESMNEGAATVMRDGTVLYCNSRFAEMAATPAEQIVGSRLWDRVVPAQREAVRGLAAGALHVGARAELTLSGPDGPGLPVLLSLRPTHQDSDIIAVVAADLSERKRAEEALRQAHDTLEQRVRDRTAELQEQREWLTVTLSSIGDALIATDAAGRITFLNPVAETLTGWSRQEVLGQPVQTVFRVLDEASRNPGEDIVARVLREGAAVKLANNTCLITRAGQEIPVEDSAAPIRDTAGKVAGAVLVFRDVAAKRRAQHALHESEARYKHAQQIANVGSWEWDIPTGALWWSEQTYRQMGEQPGRVTPTRDLFWERVHPEDRAAFDAAVQRALAGTAPYDGEFRIVRPDGAVRVLHSRAEVQPGPDGRPRSMVGVCLDITERKQAERDLFAVNQRLQALMQALPVGVSFSDDPTCQRITGNPAALAQFEVTGADNLSASAPDADAPGRQVRFFRDGQPITDADLPLQRAVAENREIPPMELEILLPSGRRWTALASGAPVRDQQGKVTGGVAVTRDITERKRAEEALARQREELQLILDSAPAMIFYKDRDNHFLRVNRAFAESMGVPKEQLEGKSLFDLYPREQAEAYWQDDQEVLASGKPKINIVEPMRTPAGERWVQTGKVPCQDAQGNLVGIIGFALDITGRKQAEAALRESEARTRVAEAVQVERQRLQAVLDMLPVYVALLTPDYHVPVANRFFEERFGKAEGRRCYEYLFQRTTPCENCLTYNVLKTNAAQRWEWTGPDGRDYDIHDFPFTDVDGSPLIMEVGLDITERKKAEAELTKHREHLQDLVAARTFELRASNKELSRFNQAMVGRELRMIELKREINALCVQFGQPPRYAPDGHQAQA